MRQLHILFNKAKTWHRIVCWFLCIYLFLLVFAWCAHKIVLQIKTKQYYEHIMQKLVKTGKYTEINKQSHVKFWLNWRKYRTVSYSFSCNKWSKIILKNLIFKKVCLNLWKLILCKGVNAKKIAWSNEAHQAKTHKVHLNITL